MSADPGAAILLVEDGEDDAELTRRALGARGRASGFARVRDGEEALAYLRREGRWEGRRGENPRLVLLDLKMPRVDGHEFLDAVKRDPALRAIPVVVLTSSRREDDIERSYALGANGYVVKPVAYEEFVAAVGETGSFWLGVNQAPR